LFLRRYRLATVALLLVMGCLVQGCAPRPFLWQVEGEKTSYLFGTIHLPDERVLDLPPSVTDAFAASDAVFTEIPMDLASQLQISASILLPKGETLDDLLPEDLMRRSTAYVTSRGRDMDLFKRFTIWSFMMQLALLDDLERYTQATPMDFSFYQDAVADGKQAGGLETVEEQIGVFSALTAAEQSELLAQTLDYLEALDEFGGKTTAADAVVELYLDGNLDALQEELMAQTGPETATTVKFSRLLLEDRNNRMATRIADHIANQPDTGFFFAVGALHMAGEDGLPAQLRARGFTLRRVSRRTPAAAR
jgi:uncharacterized protein YbaP (TraB family)